MQLFSIDTNFEYIIRKPKRQRICFGSGQSRDTSRSGMSPFMRYYTAEDYPKVGPGSYDTLKSFNAIKTKVQTFISAGYLLEVCKSFSFSFLIFCIYMWILFIYKSIFKIFFFIIYNFYHFSASFGFLCEKKDIGLEAIKSLNHFHIFATSQKHCPAKTCIDRHKW